MWELLNESFKCSFSYFLPQTSLSSCPQLGFLVHYQTTVLYHVGKQFRRLISVPILGYRQAAILDENVREIWVSPGFFSASESKLICTLKFDENLLWQLLSIMVRRNQDTWVWSKIVSGFVEFSMFASWNHHRLWPRNSAFCRNFFN